MALHKHVKTVKTRLLKHKPALIIFADWTLHNGLDEIRDLGRDVWKEGSVVLFHSLAVPSIIFGLVVGTEMFHWLKKDIEGEFRDDCKPVEEEKPKFKRKPDYDI